MSVKWTDYGSNDNSERAGKDWHEKVRDLGNYKAPMRHAELSCLGCGFADYYLFYTRAGTEHMNCRKCHNNNCLAEKP